MEKFASTGGGDSALTMQILFGAYLTTARARHTAAWCEKKLVGPMRDAVAIPEGITIMDNPVADARRCAGKLLAAHCKECGRCELSARA